MCFPSGTGIPTWSMCGFDIGPMLDEVWMRSCGSQRRGEAKCLLHQVQERAHRIIRQNNQQ